MLTQRIDADLKEAMRSRDKVRLATLRLLKSALTNREIESGKPPGDAEVIAAIGSLVKQRRDAAAQYAAASRPELAANENAEIAVLEGYLPRQLTDAELAGMVQEAIAGAGATGPKDVGVVMKALMPKVQGRAEGKRVSEAVKAGLAARGG